MFTNQFLMKYTSYVSSSALSAGFNWLHRIGGMAYIQEHTFRLAHRLVCSLRAIKHNKIQPVLTEGHLEYGYGSLATGGTETGQDMVEVYGWDEPMPSKDSHGMNKSTSSVNTK